MTIFHYSKNPLFIGRNNCNKEQVRTHIYADMIVKGILDYGCSGCISKITIDNGGSGGKIDLYKDKYNVYKFLLNDLWYVLYDDYK